MITDTSTSSLKKISELSSRKKSRDASKVFIAEGWRLVAEAPEELIRELYISASFHASADADRKRFISEHSDICHLISDKAFSRISDTDTPQGILAVMERCESDIEKMLSREKNPLLLIIDRVQDPGNLGTIFRSSEAAGVTGILLCKGTVDIYQPKVVRSTMGSIYRLPFAHADSAKEAAMLLKKRGVIIAAADIGDYISYDMIDSKKSLAYIIGNEGNGLSEAAKCSADIFVSIPMLGKVESLNAAVTASILVFDAARRRRG